MYFWYSRMLNGLPDLLSNCDYVCNLLPNTSQTQGLLDGEILKHCQHKVC